MRRARATSATIRYTEQIGGADLIKAYYWAPTAEDRAHNLIVNYSYNIPTVTQIPVLKQLASDWQVSGITKLLSGAGVTPTLQLEWHRRE